MRRSLRTGPAGLERSSLSRPRIFMAMFRTASSQTLIRVAIAVGFAWVVPAALSVMRGGATFLSFLTDYASMTRFLIIVPVLILAEPPLRERLDLVVDHVEQFFVPRDQVSNFQAKWTASVKLRDSKLVQGLLILLTYGTAGFFGQYLSPEGHEFVSWWRGGGGFRAFSPAGTWAFFISYPILVYLIYLWLWRQLLWVWFMWTTTRYNLRLVAAHPDNLGGLGLLEASLRGQLPFSFCMGVGLAGAVANRMFNEGEKLVAFRHLPVILVAAVLLICVAPYFVFTSTLMRMRRRGMLRYGAFARAVGEQFEQKWLERADSLDADVLTVPDFSTTADLFGLVSNINDIRVIPVGAVDLYALIGIALAPGIPVIIGAIPFDTVMADAMKLLF
jgi:hypothetical protein